MCKIGIRKSPAETDILILGQIFMKKYPTFLYYEYPLHLQEAHFYILIYNGSEMDQSGFIVECVIFICFIIIILIVLFFLYRKRKRETGERGYS